MSTRRTFGYFFDHLNQIDELLDELGYRLVLEPLTLPEGTVEEPLLQEIGAAFQRRLAYVPLANEAARREFYVSPILLNLLDLLPFKLNIEYEVNTDQLYGTVDYLLRATRNIVVIEAKHADIERGFAQLAAELIAVHDKFAEGPLVYGAVTTGDIWRFGILDAQRKVIRKDINLYVVPQNLRQLMSTLRGMLTQ